MKIVITDTRLKWKDAMTLLWRVQNLLNIKVSEITFDMRIVRIIDSSAIAILSEIAKLTITNKFELTMMNLRQNLYDTLCIISMDKLATLKKI